MERGTILIANENNQYSITDENSLCEYLGGDVVRCIAHKSYGVGKEYNVVLDKFHPATEREIAEWEQKFPSAIYAEDYEQVKERYLKVCTNNDIIPKNAEVMDASKGAEFSISDEELANLKANEKKLLDEYGYGYTDEGLDAWNREWFKNKGWLLYWMSRHPNYVPGKFMIVFSSDYKREFDSNGVKAFANWGRDNLPPMEEVNNYGAWSPFELKDIINKLTYKADLMETCSATWNTDNVTVCGQSMSEVVRERNFFQKIYRKLESDYDLLGNVVFKKGSKRRRDDIRTWFNAFEAYVKCPQCSADVAQKLNQYAAKCDVDLRAAEGQKVTKVARKFCAAVGMDTIRDVRMDPVTGRERDYGFNKQIAMLGDAVNPMTMHRYTVLSANPIDYLTMSFGNSWASCHTIDKENRRRDKNGSKTYGGCYSSGTLSYMLDGASLIYYQVDASEENKDLEFKDKMCREVFCLGHDKMIQSRLYPYGRDSEGTSEAKSLQTQIRECVEKIVSDMFHCNNLWTTAKGSDACHDVTRSCGTHYRDYIEYEDGVVCYLNTGNGKNTDRITIGHNPICPICGKEHEREDWITCGGDFDACDNGGDGRSVIGYCEACGEPIYEGDDYIEDASTGHLYCDSDCANRDDVYYCNNTDDYRSEDVYYCDRTEEMFCDLAEERVEVDGHIFMNADMASDAGYGYADDVEEWRSLDELHYCEKCDRYVTEENWNAEKECCVDCADEEEN